MDTKALRAHLTTFLGRLSRLDYLTVFAALRLADDPATDVVERLPVAIKAFSDRSPDDTDRELDESTIEVQPQQVAELCKELPNFVVDLLIVDLEAFIHGFLSDVAGQARQDDVLSVETLVAKVWPKDVRWTSQEKKSGMGKSGRAEHWSYSDIVLLAEVRNAIVHGNGEVLLTRSKQRLLAAGWSEAALADSRVLKKRGLNDLFRFKRAVRTLANEILNHSERSEALK